MRSVILTDDAVLPDMTEMQQYRHPLLWQQFSGGLCKRNMLCIRHVTEHMQRCKAQNFQRQPWLLVLEQLLGHAKWASATLSNTFTG